MLKQNDYQVLTITPNSFDLYLRGDKRNWIYQRTLTSEEEVQAFIQEQQLTLIETGVHGVWPMRNYRQLNAADLVVARVMSTPTPKRQCEDW